MKVFSTVLTLCILLSACQTSSDSAPSEEAIINIEARNRLDSTLQSFISDSLVAGVSALVFESGEEAYFKALGYADRENKVPMDRNTIVTIYSMTKPITGVSLMTLYEKGAFDLDDSLAKHAPEFTDMQVLTGWTETGEMILEPADRAITIADITRHTAGFSGRTDLKLDSLEGQANLMDFQSTLPEMAQKLSELPLGYQPGQRWEYGISVDVQAYLVEKLSGQPFDEYMREVVLDPLGMDETGYFVPEGKRERVAALYGMENGKLNRVPDQVHALNYNDVSLKPGGWGLKSTIDDYMKFSQMLVNEGTYKGKTILKPETVKLMATNHLPAVEDSLWLPSKGRVGFGIDFAVRTDPPKTKDENNGAVGEFFWDGAASTLFWVDPKNDLTAVLFVQIFPFNGIIHKKFKDAVYGEFGE